MNRGFKFRIWNVDSKSWENPYYMALKCNVTEGNAQVLGSYDIFSSFGERHSNFVIQQFTGLKDKNGKEIYEGDLLRVWNTDTSTGEDLSWNGEVYWDNSFSQFRFGGGGLSYTLSSCQIFMQVIGNIFENTAIKNVMTEQSGRRAFLRGRKYYENPYATEQEKSDMIEFAPWTPDWRSGKNENLPAYYWHCEWESAKEARDKYEDIPHEQR